jgi:hypothetical protein
MAELPSHVSTSEHVFTAARAMLKTGFPLPKRDSCHPRATEDKYPLHAAGCPFAPQKGSPHIATETEAEMCRRSNPMNAQAVEALIEKLKLIPPEQRSEVEDFVDFLKARNERRRDAAAQRLGEAFTKLDALNSPPLTPEELQAEIDAARAERRARHADRR